MTQEKKDEGILGIVKDAESIMDDLIGNIPDLTPNSDDFEGGKSAFGHLINEQVKQLSLVSKTYEKELVEMDKQIKNLSKDCTAYEGKSTELDEKVKQLKDDKEKLEVCLDKYAKTIEKYEREAKKNGPKKPKQKKA